MLPRLMKKEKRRVRRGEMLEEQAVVEESVKSCRRKGTALK